MRLAALVDDARRAAPALGWSIIGDPAVAVSGLAYDSRAARDGDLFFCVPGAVADGHRFASQALAAGAVAIVVDHQLSLEVDAQVVVAEVRPAMALLSSAFHAHPSGDLAIVGVTGTNGKTTTVELIGAVLAYSGRHAATIGTLTGSRTTPEAPDLQHTLRAMADDGVVAVAMEVSSHALTQHRVTGTRFAVGVFTNLSPDHLDYHADLEDYFAAKASLFVPELVDAAVINVDDPYGRRLAESVAVPVTPTSRTDVEILDVDLAGTRLRWRDHDIHLHLPGHFNIDNAISAATALGLLGLDDPTIAEGLSSATVVPGRFEVVPGPEGAPTVIVDYSHTPDGIEKVLASVRAIRPDAAVTIVFGCGGDRDPTKRPLMAAAAEAGADRVIVTSDNPRTEDPALIVADAVAGLDEPDAATVELDRRAAIGAAIREAAPGTVVVVAGKGNETTQTIGTRAHPFDDRLVAAEWLREEFG